MQTKSMTLPTLELRQAGQSPWLDYISREFLKSGKLRSLIEDKGLLGITSNPTIFEKAISQPQGGYEKDIQKFLRKGASTLEIYDALTIADIRETCDLFRGVFEESHGEHGFVSLEVLPGLAHEVEATIAEAKRLFKAVNRPNVMIKVPATPEGIPAVRQLIGSGVNINITLMFSLKHYQDVAHAYIAGLEDFKSRGGDISKVHSVASVFVSRIDTHIDKKLDAWIAETQDSAKKAKLESLKGKAAVANSKMIYQEFKKIFGAQKFKALESSGATIQKVLWGSTSTKNPNYPDLIYVDTLIGRETVNTMPQQTLEAFLDHGEVRENSVEEGLEQARQILGELSSLGLDCGKVGEILQHEGVKSFSDSFDSLMRTLEWVREKESEGRKSNETKILFSLAAAEKQSLAKKIAQIEKENFHARFLKGDASLWKKESEHHVVIANRLGWLRVQDWMLGKLYEIDQLKQQIERDGIKDIILLGMGGSSLAPEVMSLILKRKSRQPRFHVLDTTDPASILKVEKAIRLKSSLFIVASKSGSTIETLSQFQYFYDKVQKSGSHFIAITDAGSSLEKLAREKKFRKIFINPTDIGGRYSALSFFGMVPAALLGFDVRQVLKSARGFFARFEQQPKLQNNPTISLGILFAELAKTGRDKLTFLTSKNLSSFGTWLEQLIAESTGKEGEGVIPVEGETPAAPSDYGKDRAFVVMKSPGEADVGLSRQSKALKKAGFPVVEIEWPDAASIGAEFLRWEIITVVSGAVLGINPFDEPNVRESKENTARFLNEIKQKGKFKIPADLAEIKSAIPFVSFFSKLQKSGYIVFLSYTERSPQAQKVFSRMRSALRAHFQAPVILGFGPRYLHSIGQLYKGGPRKGIFIELLIDEAKDIRIPGEAYSFGQLKTAQALGDREALESKGLPVLTVNLGKSFPAGIVAFEKQLNAFLRSQTRKK